MAYQNGSQSLSNSHPRAFCCKSERSIPQVMHPSIPRILSQLGDVRRRNPESFGKGRHHFNLQKPLEEETIAEFEAEHGVRLPEEFREFLLYAGGSGAGPYYGL